MPYVVTTSTPDPGLTGHDEPVARSRRAVATLEEACDYAEDEAYRTNPSLGALSTGMDAFDEIPESGGTVGPLPDGTVIEVAPAPWLETQADIDAYNARALARGVS